MATDLVLSSLKYHQGLALRLGGGDGLEVASSASFVDNSRDRKSSQAYVHRNLIGGMVCWRAKKQDTATNTSTTQWELLPLEGEVIFCKVKLILGMK